MLETFEVVGNSLFFIKMSSVSLKSGQESQWNQTIFLILGYINKTKINDII